MPERAALIAVLIDSRPLCVPCISDKSLVPIAQVEYFLARIERGIEAMRGTDRCRACGAEGVVYSLVRQD